MLLPRTRSSIFFTMSSRQVVLNHFKSTLTVCTSLSSACPSVRLFSRKLILPFSGIPYFSASSPCLAFGTRQHLPKLIVRHVCRTRRPKPMGGSCLQRRQINVVLLLELHVVTLVACIVQELRVGLVHQCLAKNFNPDVLTSPPGGDSSLPGARATASDPPTGSSRPSERPGSIASCTVECVQNLLSFFQQLSLCDFCCRLNTSYLRGVCNGLWRQRGFW
jgi:hypothetical protein